MRLALAQLNPVVGDVTGNAHALGAAYAEAVGGGAQLVAATELALTGYPPEDLVLKPAFLDAVGQALESLAGGIGEVPLVVGFVERLPPLQETLQGTARPAGSPYPPLANAAAVLRGGAVAAVYRKVRLPNYGVFDEARYFLPGSALGAGPSGRPVTFDVGGVRVGVTICEDLWGEGGPVPEAAAAGAGVVLNLNASPYTRGKPAEREHWARHHATTSGVWLAYVNQVGGQDEVVFDGSSFVVAPDGEILHRGPQFATGIVYADLRLGAAGLKPAAAAPPRLDPVAEVYEALVLGTRDYVTKNGFEGALVGISGGVDSALVAAIAADALGADRVTGVAMPSPYSSGGSLTDAKKLAGQLGIRYLELPIAEVMRAFGEALAEPFAGTEPGVAEENLQSRIRGTLLMALSNKWGHILLATGNKSEYAVGYATLYGDMAGGFAVIKDVPKTLVYELCHARNARAGTDLIPRETLEKPPSAELRPDQVDTDSLPPYDVLDPILEAYVEHDASLEEIVAQGFQRDTVARVIRMVDRAEYKRRQAAPGVKITRRAFGKDRRLPITQHFTPPTVHQFGNVHHFGGIPPK